MSFRFFKFYTQTNCRLFSTSNQTLWTFNEATQWISKFNKDKIPQDQLRIQFSRSSGPGGQNVNKGLYIIIFIVHYLFYYNIQYIYIHVQVIILNNKLTEKKWSKHKGRHEVTDI